MKFTWIAASVAALALAVVPAAFAQTMHHTMMHHTMTMHHTMMHHGMTMHHKMMMHHMM